MSNMFKIQRSYIDLPRETEQKLKQTLDRLNELQYDHQKNFKSKSSADVSFEKMYDKHVTETQRCKLGNEEKYQEGLHGIIRDDSLDEELMNEQEDKIKDKQYIRMQKFREKLPAYQMKDEIVSTIKKNRVVIIGGETGCGKTTQVSQFILDSYIKKGKGSLCHVVCTQPRRISAISVANRVAHERAEKCGTSVGYQIRFDKNPSRAKGSIMYCTVGIVLKWLENDPWLRNISHLILDEVHERDMLTDFLLIIVKKILRQRRNLKIVIMSASLNAVEFSKYFEAIDRNCPILTIPGYTFAIECYYLEDVLDITDYRQPVKGTNRRRPVNIDWKTRKAEEKYKMELNKFLQRTPHMYSKHVVEYLRNADESSINFDLVVRLIEFICRNEKPGAILVFLPGWDEIDRVDELMSELRYFQTDKTVVYTLHSLMPMENQQDIFNLPGEGVRKIILSTNIAETSITIDDVVYVVDCGKMKVNRLDTRNHVTMLETEWITQANAEQRRGRAGRVQPGKCFHLFSRARFKLLEQHPIPEICRTRLEELCLDVKLLKLGKIIPFLSEALEPPEAGAIAISLEFLKNMNAINENEDLTPLGYQLAWLPLDPETGKMIIYATIFSCLDPITTVTAVMNYKDPFVLPRTINKKKIILQKMKLAENTKSDHICLVNAYKGWIRAKERKGTDYCYEYFLARSTLSMLSEMKEQFFTYLMELNFVPDRSRMNNQELNRHSDEEKLLLAIICAGLYPNVACLRHAKLDRCLQVKKSSLSTKHEREVHFHMKSVNEDQERFESPWLIYRDRMKTKNGVYLHDSSMISPLTLILFGGKLKTEELEDQEGLVVGDWIKFYCSRRHANLLMRLRSELDELIVHKIMHPEIIKWDELSKDSVICKTVIELLKTENFKRAGCHVIVDLPSVDSD